MNTKIALKATVYMICMAACLGIGKLTADGLRAQSAIAAARDGLSGCERKLERMSKKMSDLSAGLQGIGHGQIRLDAKGSEISATSSERITFLSLQRKDGKPGSIMFTFNSSGTPIIAVRDGNSGTSVQANLVELIAKSGVSQDISKLFQAAEQKGKAD